MTQESINECAECGEPIIEDCIWLHDADYLGELDAYNLNKDHAVRRLEEEPSVEQVEKWRDIGRGGPR